VGDRRLERIVAESHNEADTAAMAAKTYMVIDSHMMWIDEASQHDKNAPDNRHTP
jgi:hypothetical protein